MSLPRCLFVLSADFGEYVTANILSRGQPVERRFALPAQLAPYASGNPEGIVRYSDAADLERLIGAERPDAVILCSGYLFAINGLFGPDALAALVARARREGIALATTDPWLRIWALRPATRFAIRSIRQGGVDAAQSEKVMALQRRLEDALAEVPHLFAVPMPADARWKSVFNPAFSARQPAAVEQEWLFVLSKEDFALQAGPDGAKFFAALSARIEELLAVKENRLRFIGPPPLGRFLGERFAGRERLAFLPFSDFAGFEAAVRRAKIVVYWNVLSASLLYCLYHGVAPVFFGKGHQASVCEGLYEHVVEHVYRGRAPALLDLGRALAPRAGELIESLGLASWLAAIRADYERMPALPGVIQSWRR